MTEKHLGEKKSSLGGLEPPTFRLTAERANRLRHRDLDIEVGHFRLPLPGESVLHLVQNEIDMIHLGSVAEWSKALV